MLQEKLRDKVFKLQKVYGGDNLADLLTKALDEATVAKHLRYMGVEFWSGRPQCAPTLSK